MLLSQMLGPVPLMPASMVRKTLGSLWEFQLCSNNIFSPLSVEIFQMLKPLEYVPDSELPEARAPVHC